MHKEIRRCLDNLVTKGTGVSLFYISRGIHTKKHVSCMLISV